MRERRLREKRKMERERESGTVERGLRERD